MPIPETDNKILMPKRKTFCYKIFLLLLASLTLLACSQKNTKLGLPPTPIDTIRASETPEQLLARAMTAQEPDKSKLQLRISQLYWQNNLIGQAKAAIDTLNPRFLSAKEKLNYLKIRIEIAKLEDDRQLVESLAENYEFSASNAPLEEQLSLINLQIETLKFLERHIEIAILLSESAGLFDSSSLDSINEQIWTELKLAKTQDLTQHQYEGNHYDAAGWLELAKTFKLNLNNIDQQLSAISQWEADWAAHPAALVPPREIQILKSLPTTRPTQVTLALPLSGPLANVGKAVRDGFFAAFYKETNTDTPSDKIALFDTHKNDIETLYDQEFEERSLIVGPLDKNSLEKITLLDSLQTKTLALNNVQGENPHENLYHFGLAPESGISQVAERLIKKEQFRVAVIAPEADWGIRAHNSFRDSVLEQNGILVNSSFYGDQASLSASVAQLLATDASKNRARKLRSITGISLYNEARRRQDIDAIFMIAKPETAKLLKPLFAFHYASNIPVYASSQVHDPASLNFDLNGVEFIELPWMLSSTDILKTTIQDMAPEQAEKYSRFYALGADAFKLVPRLQLLAEISESQIQGQTGLLAINEQRKITRTMQWAKFIKGRAIPIQD